MNFMAVRLQRRGRVGPRPGVAIFQTVAPSLGRLLNGKQFQKQCVCLRQAVGERNHHQRPIPEVFVLVVLHQPSANVAGLAGVYAQQTRF